MHLKVALAPQFLRQEPKSSHRIFIGCQYHRGRIASCVDALLSQDEQL